MVIHEEKVLQNVIKQFDGMNKIEVYDLLHKVERLLQGFSSPIRFRDIKNKVVPTYINENNIVIDNSGYCYLEDYCLYLKIYRIKHIFPSFGSSGVRYFMISGQKQLRHFDRINIEAGFYNTRLETEVTHYLKNNSVTKRNSKTNRLLLLELLDQIDPK